MKNRVKFVRAFERTLDRMKADAKKTQEGSIIKLFFLSSLWRGKKS